MSASLLGQAVSKYKEKFGASMFTSATALEKQGLTFGYFSEMLGGGNVNGINESEFFNIIKREVGGGIDDQSFATYKQRLTKQIAKGFAVGAFEANMGPQASTLGANLGSMEPRIYNFLASNLRNLISDPAYATGGQEVNEKNIANFMFLFFLEKKEPLDDMEALKEYTKTMKSLSGRKKFWRYGR